jgi:hypothetical protein
MTCVKAHNSLSKIPQQRKKFNADCDSKLCLFEG